MLDRTIENPVTRERATWVEGAGESGGKRTVIDLEVAGGGGPPGHSHDEHEERIDVLEGEIEVTMEGRIRRLGPGEHVIIRPGQVHGWRNPSAEKVLRFRGMHTPGNPGFETALRVLFGLARDGEVRASGIPKRLEDVAMIVKWNQGLPSGPLRLLGPLMRWAARRAETRGRAAELLRRYASDEPGPIGVPAAHAGAVR